MRIKSYYYLDEKFKSDLEKGAKEIVGEEDRFRGDKISIAPLEITTLAEDRGDRSGHFHYRNDIVEFYCQDPQSNISRSQLFTEAKRFAEVRSKSASYTPEAKRKFVLSKGNIVYISGQAGIGKSTLSKVLVKEMLDPEINLFEPEVVIFLRFRDVNYKKKTDCLQFLTSSLSILKNYDEKSREILLKKVDECEDVYIVMDGLDEAILGKSINLPNCDVNSKETAEVFITNLLCGNILPNSKKIITSRPRQLTRLPEECRSKFLVKILGLSDESQEQICRNLCGDDSSRQDLMLGHINSRPDLKSYCYVPINCILIMLSFNEMDSSEWKNVDSLTSILVIALDEWFLKKLKGNFQIKQISELAYRGFLKNRYYFEEWDLKKARINFHNMTTFLTNNFKFQLLNGSEIISYFAHLMWQELFVAVQLRLYITKEEFKNLIASSELSNDKFEVVTRFLFGLCNKNTRRKLLRHVDVEETATTSDFKECKEMLKTFALKLLNEFYENSDTLFLDEAGSDVSEHDEIGTATDVPQNEDTPLHDKDIENAAGAFDNDGMFCSDGGDNDDDTGRNSQKDIANNQNVDVVGGDDVTDVDQTSCSIIADYPEAIDIGDEAGTCKIFETVNDAVVGNNSISDNDEKKAKANRTGTIPSNPESHAGNCFVVNEVAAADHASEDLNTKSAAAAVVPDNDNGRDDDGDCNDDSNDDYNDDNYNKDNDGNNEDDDSDDKDDENDNEEVDEDGNICDDFDLGEEEDDGYFSKILPIMQWVYEMRDQEFTKQAAACLRNEVVISQGHIVPTEIPSFNHVLRARETALSLKLVEPSFAGNSVLYCINELDITIEENQNVTVS